MSELPPNKAPGIAGLRAPLNICNTSLPTPLVAQWIRPSPSTLDEINALGKPPSTTSKTAKTRTPSPQYLHLAEEVKVTSLFEPVLQSENLLVAEDFETLGFEGEERSHTSMANITFNSDVVGVVLKYLDEHIVTHIDVVSEESTFDRREMSKIDVARALAPSLTQTKILKAAADRSTNAPRLILEFLNFLVVLFPHVNVAEHVVRELAPVLLSCESDEKSRKPDTNTNIDKEIETLTKALAWRCVHKLAFPLAIGEKKNILKAGAATAQSRCGNTGGEGLDRAVYFLNTCAAFFFDDIDSS